MKQRISVAVLLCLIMLNTDRPAQVQPDVEGLSSERLQRLDRVMQSYVDDKQMRVTIL
ncbi:MAG: hypothetical protein ACOX5R_13025 [bacterium]|jgi:hypothetical protein